MSGLAPKLEILPDGQRQIWPRLDATPDHFVLYGGTALAMRLGHRESVDFDFFSRRSFEPLDLARSVPYLKDQIITQQGENTLSCDISTEAGPVKVSFFGALSLGQLEPPDLIANNNVAIASLSSPYSPSYRSEGPTGPVAGAFRDRAHRKRTCLYGEDA